MLNFQKHETRHSFLDFFASGSIDNNIRARFVSFIFLPLDPDRPIFLSIAWNLIFDVISLSPLQDSRNFQISVVSNLCFFLNLVNNMMAQKYNFFC